MRKNLRFRSAKVAEGQSAKGRPQGSERLVQQG